MRLCPKCDSKMKLKMPDSVIDPELSKWECDECGYYERFRISAARRQHGQPAAEYKHQITMMR